MKLPIMAGIALAFLLLAQGCSRLSVADELKQYQNQDLFPLRHFEVERQESLQSITSQRNPTMEQAITTLQAVTIPAQEKLLDGIKNIHPQAPEIQELHQAHLTFETDFLEFLKTFLEAKQ